MTRLAPINPLLPTTPDMAWLITIVLALVAIGGVIGLVVKSRNALRPPRRTLDEHLAEIEGLHAAGSISDEERDAARRRILDGL